MAIDRHYGTGKPGLTRAQREAIEEAMRIILEDDYASGLTADGTFGCARCQRARPLAGSIEYGEHRLCHECATRYELARVEGSVRTCAEYVSGTRDRRGDAT